MDPAPSVALRDPDHLGDPVDLVTVLDPRPWDGSHVIQTDVSRAPMNGLVTQPLLGHRGTDELSP